MPPVNVTDALATHVAQEKGEPKRTFNKTNARNRNEGERLSAFPKVVGVNRLKFAVLLFGIFVTSFGVLTFEISLTRIFSVMYSYHYTFLAVSVALFALSLGGVLTQAFSWQIPLDEIYSRLAFISVISSLASFLIFVLTSSSSSNAVTDAFIMFFPFLIVGVFLATIYNVFTTFSNVAYFADLFGAAIGALTVVFLLNFVGAVRAVLLVGALTSIASLFFALSSKRKIVTLVAIADIVLMAFFVQYSTRTNLSDIPFMGSQGKELEEILADQSLGARIIDSRWSAFGRSDLIELEADPHSKVIFVDGGAGTRMLHFDGDFNSSSGDVPSLRYTTQYFPYYFVNKGNSLVIGPGGGLDVLTSLIGGMNHTTAVEVNPDIVAMVRDYSSYNGGIYTRYSNVHVYVDEGRSYVRRSTQKYDIIMLDIPVTRTAQGSIGYALAENYLFTTDSFIDYYGRLDDDGLLTVVAHDHLEVYKLVSMAFRVLEDQGLSAQEIMRRLVVVQGEGHSGLPVFILKKTPFTDSQARLVYLKANELGFVPVYLPYVNTASLDPFLTGLADGRVSIDMAISQAPFEMAPPTDDSPFFYKFEKGIPLTLAQLLIGTVILSAALIGLYLGAWARRLSVVSKKELDSLMGKFSLFRPYYFASLGLGFMLIEIPLIQRFILFLGHPTLAIAVVLFSLLLASGLGSFYSKKWESQKLYNVFKVSLVIGITVILYILALPFVFNVYLSYDSTLRFFVAFALIFPLGFLMGIPFPIGLKFTRKEVKNDAAWMWCINGAFSVLGSVLALAVAMSFNFSAVLLSGGLIYVVIFLVGRTWAKGEMETAEMDEGKLREERELEKSAKKQRRKKWKEELWKRRIR